MYDAWKMQRVDNATVYTTDLIHIKHSYQTSFELDVHKPSRIIIL